MDNELEIQIKNIVEPYEKRIKELEEKIRTKDFEIAVLKQKLFNILNKNQKEHKTFPNDNRENMINIKFIDSNNKESIIKCEESSKTKIAFEQYKCLNEYIGLEIRNYNLTCDNNLLKPYLSLKENGLVDNSIIHVRQKNLINLIFDRRDIKSSLIVLTFDENISVGLAFIYYLLEMEDGELFLDMITEKKFSPLIFLFNSQEYRINDKTPLKNHFKNGSKILVIKTDNVIG
jgi:hypothetical protein